MMVTCSGPGNSIDTQDNTHQYDQRKNALHEAHAQQLFPNNHHGEPHVAIEKAPVASANAAAPRQVVLIHHDAEKQRRRGGAEHVSLPESGPPPVWRHKSGILPANGEVVRPGHVHMPGFPFGPPSGTSELTAPQGIFA